MNTQKTLIRFNASAAKESSCLMRTWLTVIEGYKETVPNNDIIFGSALHEYIKQMRLTNGNFALATKAALEVHASPKKIKSKKEYMESTNYLILTCQRVWTELQASPFKTLTDAAGVPLVEKQFSIPYYTDETVDVTLEGTIDDLCKHTHGAYAVNDYKSTTSWDHKEYLKGYQMSPQLMFYVMAVEYYGNKYPDGIFGKMVKAGIYSFVTGLFLAGRDKDVEVERSDVIKFSEDKMHEFRSMLNRTVRNLVACVKDKRPPLREGMFNGACQTIYGPCKFFNVCNAPDEAQRNYILKNQFAKKPYDPLNHND